MPKDRPVPFSFTPKADKTVVYTGEAVDREALGRCRAEATSDDDGAATTDEEGGQPEEQAERRDGPAVADGAAAAGVTAALLADDDVDRLALGVVDDAGADAVRA